MHFFIKTSLFATALLGVAATSQASYTWDFSGITNPGTSYSYADTTNKVDLPISGFSATDAAPVYSLGETWNTGNVTAAAMYGKNDGANETGLGFANQPDNEIDDLHFLQIDTKSLKAAGLGDLTINIGSLQQGEGYVIWGSNTADAPGVALYTGTGTPDTLTQTISNTDYSKYEFFSLSASSSLSNNKLVTNGNCVLGDGVTAQAVPEPFSISLLAVGALGLLRRKLA